jgi:hypothetical protein
VFLLAYHEITLLASTYSRAKGVCLFSFIVPELELDNIERKVIFFLTCETYRLRALAAVKQELDKRANRAWLFKKKHKKAK